MSIGENLRRLRHVHNLTLKEAAKRAGVQERSLGDWERDVHQPSFRSLEKLGSLYSVNPLAMCSPQLAEIELRRAVLLADLEAMCEAWDEMSWEHQVLNVVAYAAKRGRLDELFVEVQPLLDMWIDERAICEVGAQPRGSETPAGDGAGSERLENGRLISDKLSVIRSVCGVLADDLRNRGGDERRVRGVLSTLIFAIENDSLDSLLKVVQPWMREEIARVDALTATPPEPEVVGPFTVATA